MTSYQGGLSFDNTGALRVTDTGGSAGPTGYRAILLGDSLNAAYTGGQTVTSVVVSSGIATAETQYIPTAYPGDYVTLVNVGDTTASDEWSGKWIQVLTNPSDTSFTFSTSKADGTYTTVGGQTWQYKTKTLVNLTSEYQLLNSLLGAPMTLLANFACSGTVSAYTAAVVSKILAGGPKFDIAFLQVGSNDLANSASDSDAKAGASTLVANITSICNSLLGYGVTPVIGILPFYNSPYNSTAFPNLGATYARRGIKAYASANPKCIVIDHQENFGDGTVANAQSIANTMNTDGIHPIFTGNLMSARQMINSGVLAGSLKRLVQIPSPIWTNDDGLTNSYTGNINLVPNPGLTGTTGGSFGNAITGSVPTSWSIQDNTLPATTGITSTVGATRTVPTGGNPNLANLLKCWTLNLAAASATGQSVDIWSAPDATGFAAKMVAGQWYRAGITLNATNTWTAINKFQVSLYQSGTLTGRSAGTIGIQSATIQNTYTTDVWSLVNGDVLTLTTEPFFVPTGSTWANAFLRIQILCASSGAVSANFQLSNPFCIQVSNPYA